MTKIYREKIIGKWENDFISYVFDKQGNIIIHWIKENSQNIGNWSIENNEIIIKYGVNFHQTWKGKINLITDKELSITDLSNEIGTIDLLYRKELPPTTEQKNFKEKLTETVWGVFGIAFLVALFGGIGYLIYQGLEYESHEYTYFFIGIMLLEISAIPLVFTLYKGSDADSLMFKGFFIFYASVIIAPVLYFLLAIFFAIISSWFYIIALGVFVGIIMLVLNKEEKWIYKSVIILISIASLYFLYNAKSILKIKFEVYFDNTNVNSSLYEDE